jgi:hypothetical protein
MSAPARWSTVLVLVALTQGACRDLGTRDGLLYGSARDVEKFLGEAGREVKLTGCTNVRVGGSVSRALSCLASLSEADTAALASTFGLARGPGRAPWSEDTGRCEQRPGFAADAPGVEVWSARWGCGPPNRGFAYLTVHRVAQTGQSCIETQYNWSC